MRKGVKVTSGGDLYEDTAIIEFETQHGVATYICDARQFADGPREAIAEAQAVLDSLEPEELDEVEEAAGRIMNKADRACHWAGTEEWTYIVLSPDEGQVE